MRWTESKFEYNDLDLRTVHRVVYQFLFFPKTIKKETRWLEIAGITQKLIPKGWVFGWVNVWEDEDWYETWDAEMLVETITVIMGHIEKLEKEIECWNSMDKK